MAIGKKSEDFLIVVTDGGEFDGLLFKSRDGALQLDQLAFAKGSPIGRAKKKKNSSVSTPERVESLQPSELVVGGKSRRFLADGKSDGHGFEVDDANGVFLERSTDRYRVSEVSGSKFLGVKVVHHPVCIVIESEIRARSILEAVGRFGKSLIGIATAINDYAGPRHRFLPLPGREYSEREGHADRGQKAIFHR